MGLTWALTGGGLAELRWTVPVSHLGRYLGYYVGPYLVAKPDVTLPYLGLILGVTLGTYMVQPRVLLPSWFLMS